VLEVKGGEDVRKQKAGLTRTSLERESKAGFMSDQALRRSREDVKSRKGKDVVGFPGLGLERDGGMGFSFQYAMPGNGKDSCLRD